VVCCLLAQWRYCFDNDTVAATAVLFVADDDGVDGVNVIVHIGVVVHVYAVAVTITLLFLLLLRLLLLWIACYG
jgi:hypothetical protein